MLASFFFNDTIIRRGKARTWRQFPPPVKRYNENDTVRSLEKFSFFFRATSIRDRPTFRDTLLYLVFVRKLANFTSRKSRRVALCQRDRWKEGVLLFSFFFFPMKDATQRLRRFSLLATLLSYRALCTQTTPGIFSFFLFPLFFF